MKTCKGYTGNFTIHTINKLTTLQFYLVYTINFLIAFLILYSVFWFTGTTTIKYADGLDQYFYTFYYMGDWLRGIVSGISAGNGVQIPLWDMSIGYGADILTTLHYYGMGDPFNLLAAIADGPHREGLFIILLALRLYLAGIGFIKLCLFHRCGQGQVLLAVLVYCFSGWTILSGLRWAEFMMPLLYGPFCILGIDKIYAGQSSKLFCISTALAAVSNIYFFYMLCFMMLLYGIVGYFFYIKQFTPRKVIGWFGRFCGNFLAGLSLAAFMWLPVGLVLMEGTRSTKISFPVSFLFNKVYYATLPGGLISAADLSDGSGWGYVPIAAVCLVVLLLSRNTGNILKAGIIVSFIMLCVPFWGHILNGFSYVTHRWIWMNVLLVAFCTAKCSLQDIHRGMAGCIAGAIAVVFLSLLLMYGFRDWYVWALGGVIFLTFSGVFSIGVEKSGWLGASLLHLSVFAWIGFSVWHVYYVDDNSYSYKNYIARGTAYQIVESSRLNAVKRLEDETLFRHEVKRPVRNYADDNLSMLLGIHGVQFYFSITDSTVADYYQEVYMPNNADFSYNDLDSRVILGTLAGVKYWMTEPGGEAYLPYGYEKAKTDGETEIYQNQNYLPIGYTYDSYIPQSKWEQYSVTEKQYAMLQGCVVEDSYLPECEPGQTGKELGFVFLSGIERAEEGYYVNAEKGGYELVIGLEDKIEENAELYVILEGVQFDGSKSDADLTIQCGNARQTFNFTTERGRAYAGRHDFLFNMGSRGAGSERIVITLEDPGMYTFRNIAIMQQPLQEIGEYAAERRETVLENITLGTNTLTGTIQTEKDKLLLLAIPYNQGWTAYVDGNAAKLKKANGMFMALEIGPGEHTVELRYRTRGLFAGMILSLVSICAFAAVFVYEWRRENISSLRSNQCNE